jgi:hypothetical protein
VSARRGAALAAALAAAALAGCGGGGAATAPKGDLAWVKAPRVFQPRTLPRDRVVIAQVRNASKATLHLIAGNLVIRDAAGHRLHGSAGFTTTFAHGLFGAYQQPNPVPPAELRRLGKVIYLPAGASVPFYAAWHLPAGGREPIHIDYGSGTLAVPTAYELTAP